ncbi:MAG: AMP-binding protein, partial [Stigonema ocellatum SAG 48.90 = DSM 106950]|nr:AMP-binding protein [Stigonema ocellatum SAG 48.90 = DSM 106950]
QLPTDRPRPVVQTYRGRTQSFTVVGDLKQKLQSLSQESGTTLFMTLLAAFSTLLYRYSGQSDILVGTPIANRNRSEIESLIGFFVNTLVLRTSFEANPSFESLLSQVRETTLKAYEHQDVPFEVVVEALQPQRSLAYSPLFGVMFVLQNAPMSEVELPGITLTQLDHQSTIAKFDLTLSMSETDHGLVGSWEYNTDLFDGSTISRMAGHFQNLLSAIVENPRQTVGELPLLSAAERHQLLVEWNDTESEYLTDKCIHELFSQQVELTPDAIALVFEDEALTYSQLNTRANTIAHYLQSQGVQPDVLVGLCVERSPLMVVGLLGILKAGGTYLPLDPAYPTDRLRFMIKDAEVALVLTQQDFLDLLSEQTVPIVCLDNGVAESRYEFASRKVAKAQRERVLKYPIFSFHTSIQQRLDNHAEIPSEQSLTNPVTQVTPDHLAYVMYTSGSTGTPKGVPISHHSLATHCQHIQKYYGIDSTDRVLQFTSLNFDPSLEQIFTTLIAGATLFVRNTEVWTAAQFTSILLANRL